MQNQNANAIAAETRQSEVQQGFLRVEEIAAHIGKVTEELEAILSNSILAQRATTEPAPPPSSPSPVRVPAAQRLHDLGNHLEDVRERLSSICGRIEA